LGDSAEEGRGDFLALGWANVEKIKLLKRTADSWRHSLRSPLYAARRALRAACTAMWLTL
jgi:hypothetical protein